MTAGAMSVAEGRYDYKTDVGIVFNGSTVGRDYVLRTTFESLDTWKANNSAIPASPFEGRISSAIMQAAEIDREIWVFGVDACNATHLVNAVRIAMEYHGVGAEKFISNVYVKNLNSNSETPETLRSPELTKALVKANMALYSGLATAIKDAAQQLGVSDVLKLHVFSKNNNPKIPQAELHQALSHDGASVQTSDTRHKLKIGSNSGENFLVQRTNFHEATLKW